MVATFITPSTFTSARQAPDRQPLFSPALINLRIRSAQGRDVTFIAINGFDQKIAAGNALQSISRDMLRFARYSDLSRLLAFWGSAQGTYISTTLLIFSTYLVAFTLLALSMANTENYFTTPNTMNDLKFSVTENNFGSIGVTEVYSVQ